MLELKSKFSTHYLIKEYINFHKYLNISEPICAIDC